MPRPAVSKFCCKRLLITRSQPVLSIMGSVLIWQNWRKVNAWVFLECESVRKCWGENYPSPVWLEGVQKCWWRCLVTIRVLIADDHGILRAGLQAMLSAEPDIDVVGEAGT